MRNDGSRDDRGSRRNEVTPPNYNTQGSDPGSRASHGPHGSYDWQGNYCSQCGSGSHDTLRRNPDEYGTQGGWSGGGYGAPGNYGAQVGNAGPEGGYGYGSQDNYGSHSSFGNYGGVHGNYGRPHDQEWQIGHSRGGLRNAHFGGMSGFSGGFGGGQGEWGAGTGGFAHQTMPSASWERGATHAGTHGDTSERPVGQGASVSHGWSHGPHFGKGPKGYQRSDDRIRDEICECLTHDGHIDASDIEVVVVAGEVTLSGTVEERRMKRYAEELVEHHAGVKDVRNEIRVKRSDERSDAFGTTRETIAKSNGTNEPSRRG